MFRKPIERRLLLERQTVLKIICVFMTVPQVKKGNRTIRVTLSTKLDTLWFVKVGGPMEGFTNKYDTTPES